MLNHRHRRWLGYGLITFLDQATYSAASFLITVLLARWLAPGDFGAYTLAFSVLLFVGMFQNSLFLEPLSIFGVRKYQDSFSRYLEILGKWQFVPTLLIGASTVLIVLLLQTLIPQPWPGVLLGFAVATPAILLAWLVRRAFYVIREPAGALRSSLLQSLGTLCALFLLVHNFAASAFTAFLALGVGAALGAAVGWRGVRSRLDQTLSPLLNEREVLARHWRYGKWLAVSNLPHWAIMHGYAVWVALLLGLADVGGLRAMQALITPVAVMLTALGSLALPALVRRYDELGSGWLSRSVLRIGFLFVSLAFLLLVPVVVLGPQVDLRLYGAKYSHFLWLLPYLMVAQAIGTGAMTLSLALRCLEASRRLFYGYAAAGASVLVLGYPAVSWFGLHGIGGGIVMSQAILVAVLLFQWRRALRDVEPVPAALRGSTPAVSGALP